MQALNAFFWSAEYILLSRLNRNPSLSHNDDHVTVMQTLVLSSVVALSFGQCPELVSWAHRPTMPKS